MKETLKTHQIYPKNVSTRLEGARGMKSKRKRARNEGEKQWWLRNPKNNPFPNWVYNPRHRPCLESLGYAQAWALPLSKHGPCMALQLIRSQARAVLSSLSSLFASTIYSEPMLGLAVPHARGYLGPWHLQPSPVFIAFSCTHYSTTIKLHIKTRDQPSQHFLSILNMKL